MTLRYLHSGKIQQLWLEWEVVLNPMEGVQPLISQFPIFRFHPSSQSHFLAARKDHHFHAWFRLWLEYHYLQIDQFHRINHPRPVANVVEYKQVDLSLVFKNVQFFSISFRTHFENLKPDGHSMTSKSWYTTLTFIPSDFVATLFVNSLNKPLSLRFRFWLWKSINEDLPKDGASIIRWEFWKFLALIPEFNYLFWFAKIRRLSVSQKSFVGKFRKFNFEKYQRAVRSWNNTVGLTLTNL